MRNYILLLILVVVQFETIAQDTSELKKDYKNTIRLNITNPLIFGTRSIIFGYERMLKKNRSISVNLGQASFPGFTFKNSDSLKAGSDLNQRGYNFSIDYRYYLTNENKYAAPRGVYIGPYYTFNYFERKNNWTIKSTDGGAPQNVESKTSLAVSCIGFEMGYQFVFWNKVTLDMILVGPGVGFYKLKASLGSNLSEEDKTKLFDVLNQALTDKIPGYSLVIDEGEFEKDGTASTTALGFRYMVMIGFRF